MLKYLFVCAFFVSSLSPMGAQTSVSEADPGFQQQLHAAREATAAGTFKDALEAFKRLNKLQNNSCAVCSIGMAVAYQRMSEFENPLRALIELLPWPQTIKSEHRLTV
jgi:hypothetical protein